MRNAGGERHGVVAVPGGMPGKGGEGQGCEGHHPPARCPCKGPGVPCTDPNRPREEGSHHVGPHAGDVPGVLADDFRADRFGQG